MERFIFNSVNKKDFRRELRKNSTPQEIKLWRRLCNRQLKYKFKRQYGIGPYVVDFFCSKRRLVIELDGAQHLENKEYDSERTRYMNALDCRVLRFWNNEIDKNLDGVIMRVHEVLSTSPQPSPTLGEGGRFTMNIQTNKSLKDLNTFGIDAAAEFFVTLNSTDEIPELLNLPEFKNNRHLFLGGGSNLLFTQDFEGLVIKNNLHGIEVVKTDDEHVWVRSMSGENWHDFVMYCVEQGWGGIENLSLIPGIVGAAPVQNIGAYGSELKDTIEIVEAVELKTGLEKTFSNQECEFGYRTSIFKTTEKGKYFITAVTFKLQKTPKLNTAYGALRSELERMGVTEPSAKEVSQAVISIRKSKLPDPQEIGNAGSFFKNPYIEKTRLEELQKTYPDIPFYDTPSGLVKIPAGWLIEQAGWKGKCVGNTGVHERQALVLVNHGNATGAEIKALAGDIQASIREKFGILLETEVTII